MPQNHLRCEGWRHGSSGFAFVSPFRLIMPAQLLLGLGGGGRGMPDSEVHIQHIVCLVNHESQAMTDCQW